MDTEEKIRSRIEAILTSDARGRVEVHEHFEGELPPELGDFARERELYRRIISTYRTSIAEVNSRLEENIWFLSGLCRILENVEAPGRFQEICLSVVDVVLQEFGAEYCGLSIEANGLSKNGSFCVEGVQDGNRFVSIHPGPQMAGSEELAAILRGIAGETPGGALVMDVYRDSRFASVDLPSSLRSLACLPIRSLEGGGDFIVLAHSLPNSFSDDQVRVFRILAALLAHLRRFAAGETVPARVVEPSAPHDAGRDEEPSLVMLDFDRLGPAGAPVPLDREAILSIKSHLRHQLPGRDLILLCGEQGLLLLAPDTPASLLPGRTSTLQDIFEQWRLQQGERYQMARMSIGFLPLGSDGDLFSALEAALAVMHPEQG